MPVLLPRRSAAILLALAPACAHAAAGEAAVTIDNFTFSPALLAVSSGTRVTWTNRDDIPHTVMSEATPPPFRSHPLDTGDRFTASFDRPGRFGYFCSLHPHMRGTIEVR